MFYVALCFQFYGRYRIYKNTHLRYQLIVCLFNQLLVAVDDGDDGMTKFIDHACYMCLTKYL